MHGVPQLGRHAYPVGGRNEKLADSNLDQKGECFFSLEFNHSTHHLYYSQASVFSSSSFFLSPSSCFCFCFLQDSFADIYVHHCIEASRLTFGIHLHQLAETLSLFSTLGTEGMILRYPNHENQLEIETSQAAEEGVEMNTYAKLATLETPGMTDWLDNWQGPDTSFHAPSLLLKEAIEDLEWVGGEVTLMITSEPPQVQFVSSGAGSLSVKLPESEVSGLRCTESHLKQSYSYKRLKKALTNVYSHSEDTNVLTKVSVSVEGTLKVMHMINTMQSPQQHQGATLYGNTSYFESNAAMGAASRTAIVQYVLFPLQNLGADPGSSVGGGGVGGGGGGIEGSEA